ncbi:MAG: hypothetical protein NTAFB09_01910 [Nitrosospira sp.]
MAAPAGAKEETLFYINGAKEARDTAQCRSHKHRILSHSVGLSPRAGATAKRYLARRDADVIPYASDVHARHT